MKFTKLLPLFGIISTSFVLPTTSVSAITIYDNGPLSFTSANRSDANSTSIKADDFALTSPNTTIRSVHWQGRLSDSGAQSGPGTYEVDDFTLRIYSDSSSPISAGGLLHEFAVGSAVNRTDTGVDSGGRDVYSYSADIGGAAGVALTAGTVYWLSIFNDSTTDSDGDTWLWNYGVYDGTSSQSSNPMFSTSWFLGSGTGTLGFRLDSESVDTGSTDSGGPTGPTVPSVPEPGSLGLVGLGLLGLFGSSRRRKLTKA